MTTRECIVDFINAWLEIEYYHQKKMNSGLTAMSRVYLFMYHFVESFFGAVSWEYKISQDRLVPKGFQSCFQMSYINTVLLYIWTGTRSSAVYLC